MKKQFTIKSAQLSKNIVLAAAKKEATNVLKFMEDSECCQYMPPFQGLAPKTTFSL